ncbi:uncharacterized protein LOC110862632 [Folsomia candida]|uniref:Beta/gamma crystallin 'Greek key' domain-containing protein n=1 Tax=Folsomia candida TaxID=158441 RepID=A0A226CYR2_FOLCA|nr:uncharacterized protein LOC110862632 [Folsomia candida]OXA37176.1 hypothetical protein Fcan01_28038 [Folsomia candida]
MLSKFTIFCVLVVFAQPSHGLIKVYEDINFGGASRVLPPFKACLEVNNLWRNRISSVNTGGGCVILCEQVGCRGHCEKLYPGTASHNNLEVLGLNDKVLSYKQCESRNENRIPA